MTFLKTSTREYLNKVIISLLLLWLPYKHIKWVISVWSVKLLSVFLHLLSTLFPLYWWIKHSFKINHKWMKRIVYMCELCFNILSNLMNVTSWKYARVCLGYKPKDQIVGLLVVSVFSCVVLNRSWGYPLIMHLILFPHNYNQIYWFFII